MDFHYRVIFPCVNGLKAMYKSVRVNVKIERIFSLLSDKKDRKMTGSETDLFLGYYKL